MTTAYISHPDCKLHQMAPGHPEQPDRLAAIENALSARGLLDAMPAYSAPLASAAALYAAHAQAYVDDLLATRLKDGQLRMLDPDTGMNRHSVRAARLAAGAVIQAVDLVLGGDVDKAFCNVRPPGHHAERNRAMGFCLFNNIAVGVCHALEQHGLSRVAVIDFDVHFGNGTAAIFASDPRVLLCSSYEYPLYPLSANPPSTDRQINVPLPAGCDGKNFAAAVAAHWFPALQAFAPEMVFFSAGFDAHREDPLAGLCLDAADFAWITREIISRTAGSARGRAVSALEGGYALDALGCCAQAHVSALLDNQASTPTGGAGIRRT